MRSRLFFLSPIFPILIGIIISMVYIIYFTPITLCDDNGLTLYELKTQLTLEVANYRTSIIDYEKYIDLKEQLQGISRPNFRNFSLEESYTKKIQSSITRYNESITKVHELTASIKKLESSFKTPINTNYYPRVGRGY
jgi:hypothetical protein